MRYIQKASLFSLILVLPHTLNAAPICSQWVATIVSLQGKVQTQASQEQTWQLAHTGDQVCPGDKLRVLKRSRATLQLSNDSVLTLDQNTTLSLTGPEETTVSWLLRLFDGRVFFRSRQPQHLNVQTPFINAVHEGTEFSVLVDKQHTKISVFDGAVKALNKAGQIQINKGFDGIAERDKPPRLQPLRVTPQDAVQWTLYYPPILDYQGFATDQSSPAIQKALSTYLQGDFQQALAALDTIGQSTQVLTLKAALLLNVGSIEEAQLLIQQILHSDTDQSGAFALQAIIAVTKNQQRAALDFANQAVKLDPKSPAAQIALSYAQQSLFNIDAALLAAEKATQLAPNNALAWARLSELQLSSGQQDEALATAETALKLNPKLARTQIVLGFADLARTDIGGGEQAFEQAIKLDSADPLARLGLGLAKVRAGLLEEGKQELEIAVNLDPNNAVIRSYLGKAYYELRNKEYAGKEFEIAKEMDPKDPTPWFYDAILKQTTNRPIEALQDMQKAVALNDNRGVYRSKLLLDKDIAARQAGLGRIYNGLGFDDPANRLAMKSLATDPSNYSAHRLLSDSYALKPRHEIARSSEYLQSQLLQPLSYNPVQPSLAYTDLNIIKGVGPANTAFNEYNRLFERNGLRFTSTGVYGSNSTLGDETALSGILNKFSFSLGQLHYQTDGFRANNDLKHNLYNVFAQYEISPTFNFQAEYRHRETDQGDLEFKGEIATYDPDFRRNLQQDTYRTGFKISPAQHSDFLVSLIHANRTELNHDSRSDVLLGTKSYNLESQYLFHNDFLNTILGGGAFHTDNSLDTHCLDLESQDCISNTTNYNINQYFGYFYSTIKVIEDLTITAGLSYDYFHESQGAKVSELNPKFGFIWKANRYLSFRAAGFKSVKSAIVDNQVLQPTQIAGFNQFYDDFNGTAAWQYGVGVDSQFVDNIYSGIEAYKRDLKVPSGIDSRETYTEELYRFYLNWAPKTYLAVNSAFRFENFRYSPNNPELPAYPNVVETAYVPVEIRFFVPSGFFTSLKGTYVNQKMGNKPINIDFEGFSDIYVPHNGSFKSDFYLVDAAIGYRFPKQYGLISLEAKNLFDTHFVYRDRRFQMNEQLTSDFIPERMLFARITLNF